MTTKKRQFLQVDYEIFQLVGTYTISNNKQDEKQVETINIDHLCCLIIERVNDFQKNDMQCYLTDEQFAKIFNVSSRTIKRKIHNLCAIGVLKSDVTLKNDKGQSSRSRTLSVNYRGIGICRSTFDLT